MLVDLDSDDLTMKDYGVDRPLPRMCTTYLQRCMRRLAREGSGKAQILPCHNIAMLLYTEAWAADLLRHRQATTSRCRCRMCAGDGCCRSMQLKQGTCLQIIACRLAELDALLESEAA